MNPPRSFPPQATTRSTRFVVWGICCLHRKWVHRRNENCISILAFVRIPNALEMMYNCSPCANNRFNFYLFLMITTPFMCSHLFNCLFPVLEWLSYPTTTSSWGLSPSRYWLLAHLTKCTLIVVIILYPWKILFPFFVVFSWSRSNWPDALSLIIRRIRVLMYISRIILTLTVITGAALRTRFWRKSIQIHFRLLRLTIIGFYSTEPIITCKTIVCYVKHCHTII